MDVQWNPNLRPLFGWQEIWKGALSWVIFRPSWMTLNFQFFVGKSWISGNQKWKAESLITNFSSEPSMNCWNWMCHLNQTFGFTLSRSKVNLLQTCRKKRENAWHKPRKKDMQRFKFIRRSRKKISWRSRTKSSWTWTQQSSSAHGSTQDYFKRIIFEKKSSSLKISMLQKMFWTNKKKNWSIFWRFKLMKLVLGLRWRLKKCLKFKWQTMPTLKRYRPKIQSKITSFVKRNCNFRILKKKK